MFTLYVNERTQHNAKFEFICSRPATGERGLIEALLACDANVHFDLLVRLGN